MIFKIRKILPIARIITIISVKNRGIFPRLTFKFHLVGAKNYCS